ncbi:hypothetical protein NHX12_013830 [Muraenolepis orangiensis]|uniref:Uncharacterized protein n=1 Tax=Muraenolepis orangiensis TaxID=630683 RepID=A0A9Q0DCJ2_9TELE|nr:hypothetical protein NHX12_013830 [Muraenolepis orangiensis]
MSLRAFSFPVPETRFFKAGRLEIIRVSLANLGDLRAFFSTHFHVFPDKKPWPTASTVSFNHGGHKMSAYPYVITLRLEPNAPTSGYGAKEHWTPFKAPLSRPLPCPEPPSKRSKTDSPLEAIILQEILGVEAGIPCHVIQCHVTR